MKYAFFSIVVCFIFVSSHAYAACSSPAANEGEVVYTSDWRLMQFCDGTNWVPMTGYGKSLTAAGGTGQIQFKGTGNTLQADSQLNWDNSAKSLGVGVSPGVGVKLHVESTTAGGMAIYATSTATTGVGLGVAGYSSSVDGIAVQGHATASSGVTVGVRGIVDSPTGRGVVGLASSTTGQNFGVIGYASSPTAFGVYCSSSANSTGCGGDRAWTNTSDARLKKDITELDDTYGLNAIMQLRPVSYTWRTNDTNKPELGFIAQDVETVLPTLVGNSPDAEIITDDGSKQTVTDVKSLSYSGFVVPLVKAVQELKFENDILRAQIQAMESRLSDLESKK